MIISKNCQNCIEIKFEIENVDFVRQKLWVENFELKILSQKFWVENLSEFKAIVRERSIFAQKVDCSGWMGGWMGGWIDGWM